MVAGWRRAIQSLRLRLRSGPSAALRAERKGLRAGEVSWAFDPGCDGVGPLALGVVVG